MDAMPVKHVLLLLLAMAACSTRAQPALPPAVVDALAAAGVPDTAVSALVQPLDGSAPRLAWQPRLAMNPGSVMKLVTGLAALELLGPAHSWPTPVWLQGRLRHGVLHGTLHIRGQGDPRFTPERLWLLLRRVQQWGVHRIHGDIVLDRSAFAPPTQQPGDFDGRPYRPYNVQASALLLADRSLLYTFSPDSAAGVARVQVLPSLAGHAVQATVPLQDGPCGDWQAALQASPQDPQHMRFAGRFAQACGERIWPVAYAEPAQYDARLVAATWQAVGGKLSGTVRDGPAPTSDAPSFVEHSPPLARLLPDILKHSLNTAAQQVWLSLVKQPQADDAQARSVVQAWLQQRVGELAADALLDNGSGLSRRQRLSAELLGQLLLQAWRSPLAPELLAALPINGVDGTLRRWRASPGRAHLKTGTLDEVSAVAGVVHAASGRPWLLVALVNHPQAPAARAVLDALLQWTIDDAP